MRCVGENGAKPICITTVGKWNGNHEVKVGRVDAENVTI